MLRHRSSGPLTIAALIALASGCTFYFSDDDDCAESEIYRLGQRDPSTGVCVGAGGGGGHCGDVRPQAGDDVPASPPANAIADWATCPGPCEGHDEQGCLANPSCRAAYVECPPGADCAAQWNFQECWGVAPSGPDPWPVDCATLDAYQCSRRNDCVGQYRWPQDLRTPALVLEFVACAAETQSPGCYSDQECPAGWECTADTECLPPPGCSPGEACPRVCYGRCVPAQNACDRIECPTGSHCEEVCYACDPAPGMECPTTPWCNALCVIDPPPACAATTCQPGYHCEETCTPPPPGCLGGPIGCPETCSVACVPNLDPGSCSGELLCGRPPPFCPPETVPGIRNGCYTDYCIPRWACGLMPF